MPQINRRSFLKQAAFTAAALSIPARSWSQVNGANEDIRVAVIGCHGRGANHISDYERMKGVRLVALCDVDQHVLGNSVESLKKKGCNVESFSDIRKLLESKNVDAISIATPNHWHALATIWGVQAGKDVYVEKPVSHNIWEGRKMVEAARKYNKIVQAGTQSRSSHGLRQMVEWVHAGNLGKILIGRGTCYKPRPSIGKTDGPQQVPDYIDYDLWCGPAPKDPPRRNSKRWGTVHYDWHWFWAYGNGDLGNQGVHQMDIARWFLGEKDIAPRVFSVGGRLGYEDDGETPNTMMIYHDYKKAPLIFEVRGLPEKTGSSHMDKFMDGSICAVIHCEGGHVLAPDYTKAIAYDKSGKEVKRFEGATSHFENFIKAVRSRKTSDLNAEVLEGHVSAGLCHTGNISYRIGQQHTPGEIREKIKADKDALNTFNRMADHLAANDVNLDKTKATLGAFLKFDIKKEKFNDAKANELLTRNYRAPFVVPETV